MRTVVLIVLCLILPVMAFSQARTLVQTQESQQKYYAMSTAAKDTIPSCKYIVRLVLNTQVRGDTIWIYDGAKTVALITADTTVASKTPAPLVLEYGMKMDSSVVSIKRTKASQQTLIYRTVY